jgi:hypothetical protein
MKLADFTKSGRGNRSRFVAKVTDAASQEEFEITIAGPSTVVKQMLADAEIELTIDSQRTQDQLLADFEPARKEHEKSIWELAALQDLKALLKPAPKQPQAKSSVFAAVRPVAGHGTPFVLLATGFFVPAGFSFFFGGSLSFTAVGSLRPATGDQDLFIHLFTGTGPIVSSSRLGGTSLDFVWFTTGGFFPVVPVFEVQGFTSGVCSVFSAHGA